MKNLPTLAPPPITLECTRVTLEMSLSYSELREIARILAFSPRVEKLTIKVKVRYYQEFHFHKHASQLLQLRSIHAMSCRRTVDILFSRKDERR